MSLSFSLGIIIGLVVGIPLGVLVTSFLLLCYKAQRNKLHVQGNVDQCGMELPMCNNELESSPSPAHTVANDHSSSSEKEQTSHRSWFPRVERSSVLSKSGLPRYSYKDLQKATENFMTKLGEGAFGPVFKATMPEGAVFAIKVLSSHSKQGEREFLTEVMVLGRLHHRNLVNLVGFCAERGHRILVYEYMSNGSLADFLYNEDKEVLSWNMRVQIAQNVASGIEYLHEGANPPIIHRDIKSENILLDNSMKARVADFGLSKEVSTDVPNTGVKGTVGYLDPEYILTRQFTFKSDVYSFGILLFELITARSPQRGLMDYVGLASLGTDGDEGWEEILDARISGSYNPIELRALGTLAKQCVNSKSQCRPRMKEISRQLARLGTTSTSFLYRNSLSMALRRQLQRAELSRLTSISERIQT